MSDSEDETAFASADEGEGEGAKTTGKKSASGDGAGVKKDGATAAAEAKQSSEQSQSAKSTAGKKEQAGTKGKNRRQNKSKQSGEKGPASPTGSKTGPDTGATGDSTAVGKKEMVKKGGDSAKTKGSEAAQKSPTKSPNVKKEGKPDAKAGEAEKPPAAAADGKSQASKDQKGEEVLSTPNAKGDKGTKAAEASGEQAAGTTVSPASQSIPRSLPERPTAASVLDKLVAEEEEEKKGAGWGWGSWGSSLLNVASSSVSTFKHQVGEGFHTILETVETSLGAPDPEELARAEMAKEPGDGDNGASHPASDEEEKEGEEASGKERKKEEKKVEKKVEKKEEGKKQAEEEAAKSPDSGDSSDQKPAESESAEPASQTSDNWFASWGVSSLTSKLQQKGRKLVSEGSSLVGGTLEMAESLAAGGIDALESLGKKTYSVLTERDPRLSRTRNFLNRRGERPNLSAALREARDEAEKRALEDQEFEEARKAHFGALFDEFQGLAHLEALEMLSGQSEKKVQALLGSLSEESLAAMKPQLLEVKDVFEKHQDEEEEEAELEAELEEHDFPRLVTEHLTELHLGTSPDKLNSVQQRNRKWISDFYSNEEEGKTTEPKEIHRVAISALAELTARSVEQFHKAGELVLLQKDSDTPVLNRTRSLSSLTKVLCTEIDLCSNKFCKCLNKVAEALENDDDINPLETNIYLEASNSSAYIQDAFQLLLPVLQQAAIAQAV